MKLYLYPIIALGLIASSCNNDAVEEPQPSVIAKNTITYSPSAINRTLDEAISIANEAKGMLNNSKSSRARINREIDLTDGIKYVVSNVSRSNPDTLLYILNYKDNAGFAVISTRRSTEALLAVTESGTYTSPDDCDNPGFNMFMDMATAYVANAPVNPTTPSGVDGPFEIQEVKREEIIIDSASVQPRVKVEWGQKGVYGEYCPNRLSGCSNTALGMVMSYFEHPKTINLTYNDNSIIQLDWSSIKRHIKGTSYYDDCYPESIHDNIGLMLRELGYRAGSKYKGIAWLNNAVTSTTEQGIRSAAQSLGFKLGPTKDYYKNCIRHNLGNGIIIIGGFDKNENGHMWISDGFTYMKKRVIEYVRPISSQEWIEVENVVTETIQNWFNWGYDGEYNGYYNDSAWSTEYGTYNIDPIFFTINL